MRDFIKAQIVRISRQMPIGDQIQLCDKNAYQTSKTDLAKIEY